MGKRVLCPVTGKMKPYFETEETKQLRKKLGLTTRRPIGPNKGYRYDPPASEMIEYKELGDMTPEELRAYADKVEGGGKSKPSTKGPSLVAPLEAEGGGDLPGLSITAKTSLPELKEMVKQRGYTLPEGVTTKKQISSFLQKMENAASGVGNSGDDGEDGKDL